MFQDKRRQIDAKASDGKRHLPTVLRLLTEAICKFRKNRHAKAARTAISFAGFTRESANVDFTQQLKNDSGVILKPCKR